MSREELIDRLARESYQIEYGHLRSAGWNEMHPIQRECYRQRATHLLFFLEKQVGRSFL